MCIFTSMIISVLKILEHEFEIVYQNSTIALLIDYKKSALISSSS